jgi:hypothetical protein
MQRTAATDVNYFQTRYILSRIAAIRAHLLVHICMVAALRTKCAFAAHAPMAAFGKCDRPTELSYAHLRQPSHGLKKQPKWTTDNQHQQSG